MGRRRAAREGLDDDHAAAATWTCRLVVIGSIGIGRFALRLWRSEPFADARDVVGAGGLGQQALVADGGGGRGREGEWETGGANAPAQRRLHCTSFATPFACPPPLAWGFVFCCD